MSVIFIIFIVIWLISGSFGCYLDFFHAELSYSDYKGDFAMLFGAIVLIILASTSGFYGLYIGLHSYHVNKRSNKSP